MRCILGGVIKLPIETFREFTFEAAHQLPPYSGLHGHSFRVQLVFNGDPDPAYGWATNLTDLDHPIEELRDLLDEKYLNEVEGLEVPTLENVAKWIFERLQSHAPSINRVVLCRGVTGNSEGCIYRPPVAYS